MTGYLHPHYAESLAEFGVPLRLPKSGGWLLRPTVDGVQADAMGTYSLFDCSDWKSLKRDLNQLVSPFHREPMFVGSAYTSESFSKGLPLESPAVLRIGPVFARALKERNWNLLKL